jgi:hypothetical protein
VLLTTEIAPALLVFAGPPIPVQTGLPLPGRHGPRTAVPPRFSSENQMENEQLDYQQRRTLMAKLMDAYGVRNRKIVSTFLIHCTSRSDMEHTLRVLRQNDKTEGWFK